MIEMLVVSNKDAVAFAVVVSCVQSLMFRIGHYTKVLRAVVSPVPINVVNHFTTFQPTPDHLFSNQTMLKNIACSRGGAGVLWCADSPIFTSFYPRRTPAQPVTLTATGLLRRFGVRWRKCCAAYSTVLFALFERLDGSKFGGTGGRATYFIHRNKCRKLSGTHRAGTPNVLLSIYKFPVGFCHV